MHGMTSDNPAAELMDPRRAEVHWPVRVGAVPARANEFSPRPESAPGLRPALIPGATVALVTGRTAGPDEPGAAGAPALPDWLRLAGKTQLAVAVAESLWQSRNVDLMVWATATSRTSVLAAYSEAAMATSGTAPGGSAESAAARFVGWLNETTRPWLVVLDDLSGAADLRGLWPNGPAGRVLVTAADAVAVPGGIPALPLGLFSHREALNYLMGRLSADPDRRIGAIDLVKELGCEPMALAQACAVITSSAWTCRDYQDAFVRRREQMTDPSGATLPAAAVTWTFSFEQADWLSPDVPAQPLLALIALLDGHGIPAMVLSAPAACGYLAAHHPGARPDADSAGRALLVLERAGLLTIDRTTTAPPMVRISPVLQSALRTMMPEGMLEHAARSAAGALIEAWPQEEQPGWLAESFRSCTASLWRAAGDLLWTGGCHPVLQRAGQSLDNARLTGAAADYWHDLASISERLLGADHPHTLAAVQRLTSAYLAAGRAADAVRWVQWVVDCRVRTLGSDHYDVLVARRDLGHALVAAGQLPGAITVLDQVADDCERLCGPDHLDTLGARDELAAAYLAVGRPADAAGLYRRTLEGRERVQGPRDPQTLTTREGLGDASQADGRTKDAISAYKKVLAGREKVLGPDDLDTIAIHGKLGSIYHTAGKMASAVHSYEQARSGFERVLGPDHPDTLAVRMRLARTYYEVGRLGDARTLLRDTAERCERVLPPGDRLTIQVRTSLADIGTGLRSARA
jgi:tetratricopeptide (TPR) repeat protein